MTTHLIDFLLVGCPAPQSLRIEADRREWDPMTKEHVFYAGDQWVAKVPEAIVMAIAPAGAGVPTEHTEPTEEIL
jgi:hypothetical protein